MPKTNANGQPSYGGVSGHVTSATGQQFELDPNKNLDGTEAENAQPEDERIPVVALDGPDQLTPSANTDAAAQAEDDEEPSDDQDKATPVGAKNDDTSETNAGLKPFSVPAKKATGTKK